MNNMVRLNIEIDKETMDKINKIVMATTLSLDAVVVQLIRKGIKELTPY